MSAEALGTAGDSVDLTLRRAELALGAIEDAKSGRWPQALLSSATHPGVWPILLRFASEAVTKRLAGPPR